MSLECCSRSHDFQFCRETIPDTKCSDRERSVPDLSSCPPDNTFLTNNIFLPVYFQASRKRLAMTEPCIHSTNLYTYTSTPRFDKTLNYENVGYCFPNPMIGIRRPLSERLFSTEVLSACRTEELNIGADSWRLCSATGREI